MWLSGYSWPRERTVLLEVLLAGGGELDGNELEATVLKAGDDGTDQATLGGMVSKVKLVM